MEELVLGLLLKYPVAVTILMVLGICRAVFKPIMSVASAYVQATPSIKDDAALIKVESSKIYKSLVWFLDYTLSIKLPK